MNKQEIIKKLEEKLLENLDYMKQMVDGTVKVI